MLKFDAIHVAIQSVEVLRGFSLQVNSGEMSGLIGRNGAGKTTTLRTIMGHLPLQAGSISFDGEDLSKLPRHARAGRSGPAAPHRRTRSRRLRKDCGHEPIRRPGGP